MNKKFLHLAIAVVAVGVVSFGLVRWFGTAGPAGVSVDGGYREVMGTIAHVIAVAADVETAKGCVETAFDTLNRTDEMMSDYKADSQLSEINSHGYKRPVKVDDELFEVLSQAVTYSEKSGGAFDITVGPLVDFWRGAKEKGQVPTAEEVARARTKVGYKKLILDGDGKTVRFAVDYMRLDLGGIAKGYAIDTAVEAMRRNGAIGGLVDIGGDVRCFGSSTRPGGNWVVGLQNPQPGKELVGKLRLRDMAVATSGDYQRFELIEGQKYSHIKDPVTGMAAKEFSSVTVLAPSAIEADAMATAVSVMGKEKGLKLIESLAGVEAILMLTGAGQEFIQTEGAEGYLQR